MGPTAIAFSFVWTLIRGTKSSTQENLGPASRKFPAFAAQSAAQSRLAESLPGSGFLEESSKGFTLHTGARGTGGREFELAEEFCLVHVLDVLGFPFPLVSERLSVC